MLSYLSPEINSFSALFARDALALVSGKLFGRKLNLYPLRREQIVIGHLSIGQHLLLVLVLDLGMELPRERFRRFLGSNADRFSAAYIDKRGGHFAPIAKLERALAQTTACHNCNRIGRASVDLYKSDQPLAIFSVRIFDAEFLQSEHGHTHTEHLPSTEVSMGLLGIAEIFVEGFHSRAFSYQPSAFSLASR